MAVRSPATSFRPRRGSFVAWATSPERLRRHEGLDFRARSGYARTARHGHGRDAGAQWTTRRGAISSPAPATLMRGRLATPPRRARCLSRGRSRCPGDRPAAAPARRSVPSAASASPPGSPSAPSAGSRPTRLQAASDGALDPRRPPRTPAGSPSTGARSSRSAPSWGSSCTGGALRYLAPHRFAPSRAASPVAPPAPACGAPCWSGEACQLGRCVWQRPNDVGHVAAPHAPSGGGANPYRRALLAPEGRARRAPARRRPLRGRAVSPAWRCRSARTGEVLSLVTEAPHVAPAATAWARSSTRPRPQRIYVIDAATTRLLKTIEVGAAVGQVIQVGASGRARARVAAGGARGGDAGDRVPRRDRAHPVRRRPRRPRGRRRQRQAGALTTTGQVPLPGLREPPGGAAYRVRPEPPRLRAGSRARLDDGQPGQRPR